MQDISRQVNHLPGNKPPCGRKGIIELTGKGPHQDSKKRVLPFNSPTFVPSNAIVFMSVVEMKVPVIGESINEVTLSQWLKPDGSFVKIDEPICEFEMRKTGSNIFLTPCYSGFHDIKAFIASIVEIGSQWNCNATDSGTDVQDRGTFLDDIFGNKIL